MALPSPHMRARKRFGQNFLVDDYVIGQIVDAINPKPGDNLIEIGPGHAALTRPVLERAHALTAIELDRDLVEILSHDPFLKGLNLISSLQYYLSYHLPSVKTVRKHHRHALYVTKRSC